MTWKLYLDDERLPKTFKDWTVIRTVKEAEDKILQAGLPDECSLDHDIDERANGLDFVKWLIEQDLDGKINIPFDWKWNVHSANPMGKNNMESLLKNYLSKKFIQVEE